MTAKEVITVEILRETLRRFERTIEQLDISYKRAQKIDLTMPLEEDNEVDFEALTSRFARASDIHLRKLLRIIETLELEEEGTVIDLLNRAEKRGMIESTTIFRKIRALRNEIAHEYSLREPIELYADVIANTPWLLNCVTPTKQYVDKLIRSLS